jgi:hypothetical protein
MKIFRSKRDGKIGGVCSVNGGDKKSLKNLGWKI